MSTTGLAFDGGAATAATGGCIVNTSLAGDGHISFASANFLQLQRQLTLTEDRIAAARRFYNGNVRSYNTRVQTFPSHLVAKARAGPYELQKEPFISKDSVPCTGDLCDLPNPIQVPAGHFFMMGDNRGASDDSRFWGPVPRSWIIGEAFATYWPPDRIGTL